MSHYSGAPLRVLSVGVVAQSNEPDDAEPETTALAEIPNGTPAVASAYTVQQGDTLYSIARRHGLSVPQLAQANGLARPEDLPTGRRLVIPAGGKAPRKVLNKKLATATPGLRARSDASLVAPRRDPPPTVNVSLRLPGGRYPLRWPLSGDITSRFGQRSGRSHDGIDIGAPKGSAVLAAADGEVLFADRHGGYGNLVILRHRDGLMTIYAHHDANLVRKGQRVSVGQPIAKVGETGRASGPHLHFEVRRGARPENPLQFLPP